MQNIIDHHTKKRQRITINGLFYAAISSASFGFSPLFSIALITAGLGMFDVLSYRWAVAASVLVIYSIFKKKSLRFSSYDEFRKIALMSFLRSLTSITLLIGYANIASGVASTINFMYPVIVALCMMVFYGEDRSWANVVAIVISIAGVYLMAHGDGLIVPGGDTRLGLICSLVSAFSFASYYILMKKMKADKIEAVKFSTWMMVFCAIYFIIGSFITHGKINIVTDAKSWLNILGLGLWATMVSNFTGVKAVRRIGPTLTSILGALQPLTAVILGVLFLDEHLGIRTISGISLILIAVFIIIFHQKKISGKAH
jgi:drug/metabolite transporter (DMT)-like permease